MQDHARGIHDPAETRGGPPLETRAGAPDELLGLRHRAAVTADVVEHGADGLDDAFAAVATDQLRAARGAEQAIDGRDRPAWMSHGGHDYPDGFQLAPPGGR